MGIKWVFLCSERLCPVWMHSQGNRGIEQLPEGIEYSLRIMGSEHTDSFSYSFLPWSLFPCLSYFQGSAQIFLLCFSMVLVPLAVQSEESASAVLLCPSFHIGSTTQLLRWHVWAAVKHECLLCFILEGPIFCPWEEKKMWKKKCEERWKHDLADFCGEFLLLENEGRNAEELEESALTL